MTRDGFCPYKRIWFCIWCIYVTLISGLYSPVCWVSLKYKWHYVWSKQEVSRYTAFHLAMLKCHWSNEPCSLREAFSHVPQDRPGKVLRGSAVALWLWIPGMKICKSIDGVNLLWFFFFFNHLATACLCHSGSR